MTDSDYRRWVGPPSDYDLMAGLQFSILFALGMREHHVVADLGCGSLRGGRLLIPFLLPDRYCGIEPFEQYVKDGIDAELGAQIIEVKRPRFAYRDDFALDAFGEDFDFVLAQSIFSHTHPDLAVHALERVAAALASNGLLVATYIPARRLGSARNVIAPTDGGGWAYPQAVAYSWAHFKQFLEQAGLEAIRVPWQHPRQEWFVAARRGTRAHVRAAAAMRHTFVLPWWRFLWRSIRWR